MSNDIKPPSDEEIAELINSYGIPVKIVVADGKYQMPLGYLQADDGDDPMGAILHMLKNMVEMIEAIRDGQN